MKRPPEYPKFTGNEPCRSTDPEAFYPEQWFPRHEQTLRTICGSCDMVQECREWAIWKESDGYWGGLSPADRRMIRKQRGIVLNSSESRQSVA